jgi:hypothetical protein
MEQRKPGTSGHEFVSREKDPAPNNRDFAVFTGSYSQDNGADYEEFEYRNIAHILRMVYDLQDGGTLTVTRRDFPPGDVEPLIPA